MSVLVSKMNGGFTPICNDCGICLCWDIADCEYEANRAFWDAWKCKTCNGSPMRVPVQAPMSKRNEVKKAVSCDYCTAQAPLISFGDPRYPYRADYGLLYICVPCKAWVGVHRGSTTPLGRLANAELRQWKMRAHEAYDRLWKAKMRKEKCPKGQARGAGYRWLSEQMGLPREETHIGMFSVEQCKRVVEICSPFKVGSVAS